MDTSRPTYGLIDDLEPPIRFRYVTAAQYLADRLHALAAATSHDTAEFDALHDQVVMAMADARDARDAMTPMVDDPPVATISAPLSAS